MANYPHASRRFRLHLLAATAAITIAPCAALAQTTPAPPDRAAAENEDEAIIVTGTSTARTGFDTPLAVSARDAGDIARLGVSSQADILNSIPTIKADAGGGEVASNVFIRGLPSGGQYQFTPLMYDGMPVLSTFGLNSSAYDVYYRNDLGIERLEFVRGGVSNLFGPGSVAGLINYISRTGRDELHGTVQLEVAERGRYRGDVAISGPLAPNLTFALSGFFRTDDGPLRTNLDTEGFQIRGNLRYSFPDGSGNITVYGQYIDDQVQFYLPVPLNGTTRNRAPGNDGREVFSVQNDFPLAGLGFNTPDGPFVSQIDEGVSTRGGSIALTFTKDFGDGWGLNGRTRYADYEHRFGLWSDGDGIVNVPETLGAFVTNAARRAAIPELNGITAANANFTFVGGGAVPATSLLFANRYTDRDRPMHDFTAELNLTKELTTGSTRHTFTLGAFYANAAARDINVTTTYLAEFNNQPRLVNLVVTNPNTNVQTVISRNGLLNAGGGYVNNRHEAERYAIYFADQIEADRWAFDIGGRIEHFNGDISRERTSTFVTDTTTPNLSASLRDVIWGNDGFLTGRVSTTEWALAAGGLYRVTENVNIYANASRGYFFPEIRAVGFRPPLPAPATASGSPPTQSYTGEIIKQAEIGVRYSGPGISASLAGLYTRLTNRRQVLFINDPNTPGGFIEQVNLVATESWGLEATLRVRLVNHLFFEGNLTLQDHKYTRFEQNGANNLLLVGNELERQPNFLYNAGLYYDDGTLDASLFTNYTGDNFVASNNAIVLEGFNIVNFDAGYRFRLGGDSAIRIGVNVFNLFDNDSTTEGSPRQDNNQTTGGAYFVGRPVLPRRISGRVTFTF